MGHTTGTLQHDFCRKMLSTTYVAAPLSQQMADFTSTPPGLSINLALSQNSFEPASPDHPPVSISLTVTSHATQAITIFTWPTIFNLDLSQKRANFECIDHVSNEPLRLELTKGPKRPAFSRESGGIDDAFFRTLEPETPVTFNAAFKLAGRSTEGRNAIVPGHRYRFAVRDGETVSWWRYGRKEDVMTPAGTPSTLGEASGPPITLADIASVEFEVA